MATKAEAQTQEVIDRIAEAIDFKTWILKQLDAMNADPEKQVSEEYLRRRYQEVQAEVETLKYKYFTAVTFMTTKQNESILLN